jgi:hypothetical protein
MFRKLLILLGAVLLAGTPSTFSARPQEGRGPDGHYHDPETGAAQPDMCDNGYKNEHECECNRADTKCGEDSAANPPRRGRGTAGSRLAVELTGAHRSDDESVVMDAFRTHPVVIIGGSLQHVLCSSRFVSPRVARATAASRERSHGELNADRSTRQPADRKRCVKRGDDYETHNQCVNQAWNPQGES